MVIPFDQIPSEVQIQPAAPTLHTVAEELDSFQTVLQERKAKCSTIPIQFKKTKRKPLLYTYKFFCVCPRYSPNYLCKHSNNVVIDRDVLTKDEHICYLSTPRENYAAPRKLPRYYQKKIVIPSCTARIEQLAMPNPKRVKHTLEDYKNISKAKVIRTLEHYLNKDAKDKEEVEHHEMSKALDFIDEEKRLHRVAKQLEKRRCKRIRRNILRNQRRQIRKIICVLFEEMKDFLLNDQFLIDERSTLCAVILEQIREFTDKEFYTTSNLREYQQILANNLTVWINKFISNLNIHVAPPQPAMVHRPDTENFLPVKDYIICPESDQEEYGLEEQYSDNAEEGGALDYDYNLYGSTEEENTNR